MRRNLRIIVINLNWLLFLGVNLFNGVDCRSITNSDSRQDLGQAAEIATAAVASADSYLPDLGFWADVGSLMLSGSSLSPMARLSRDVFESQECAEYVSCQVSRLSRMHSPLQFMHTFLQDLPFRGDLADRLKMGSSKSIRGDQKCGFDCSPLQYLNRGVKTLSLLHAVTRAANPRIDLRDL
ncbi:uncharacterized protein LOC110856105 isoform X2 [Folsomia candida]|uniref:uncharacterized protein LOC110856105 isoform X2 n=1 Tax=Folsomia candida TaxID=158441 RepID=UPI001604DAF1|nr:uncharacterized protein LOC110856105 isoform X2 [Folsomia candida]